MYDKHQCPMNRLKNHLHRWYKVQYTQSSIETFIIKINGTSYLRALESVIPANFYCRTKFDDCRLNVEPTKHLGNMIQNLPTTSLSPYDGFVLPAETINEAWRIFDVHSPNLRIINCFPKTDVNGMEQICSIRHVCTNCGAHLGNIEYHNQRS